LILFDNFVLHRSNKALSMTTAIFYTLFWIVCAFAFSGFICWRYGTSASFNWISGYVLEWMLSFDNLFVFHLIFTTYATPDHLKHRPLFLGICGAVFFRLVFLFIGEYLMHAMTFAHFVFGAFLVYTGVKSAMLDEDEDEDPSKNPLVQWLSRHVPFVSAYDSRGSFFVRVPVGQDGRLALPQHVRGNSDLPFDEETASDSGREVNYGSVDFGSPQAAGREPGVTYQWRATMLFLVVCCLEISDILFAVDSVSAIVAQVNDLFLAYTSAIFAMLGLRATFFIIDVLVQVFSLLKYGVAAVLVFVGLKLIASNVYSVPAGAVCLVLCLTLSTSIVASVVRDRFLEVAEPPSAKSGSPLLRERGQQCHRADAHVGY